MKGLLISNKFRLGCQIGRGSYGEVYLGSDIETNEDVAIKLEQLSTEPPQLLLSEARFYEILQGGTGIPKLICSGVTLHHNFLVMNLLGPSLHDLFIAHNRKFSLKTILMLADQLIDRVELVHSKLCLHGDIKPQNLLMGLGQHSNQVHMIDFGLARNYWDTGTQQHIAHRTNQGPVGTPKYASRNTHLAVQQSRRDDLESVGLVLMDFLRGGILPWQGLKSETAEQRYKRLPQRMISTSIETLCRGFPKEFAMYLDYCRTLEFDEKPDYAYLKGLFSDLFRRQGFHYDLVFDWTAPMCQQQSQIANTIPSWKPRPSADTISQMYVPPISYRQILVSGV